MRRITLALLVALAALAALHGRGARAGDEWQPPENGEVRAKAVSALVLLLEKARADGCSVGPLATRSLTWVSSYGVSKFGMDDETLAFVASTGVSADEVAWTGDQVLQVMRLLDLDRTPLETLEKRERALATELALRAAKVMALVPKESAWANAVQSLVRLETESVELARPRAPGADPEPAQDAMRMRMFSGLSVVLRLSTLRSAANELEAVPARTLDLLDELEEARSAHADQVRLIEEKNLRDPKKQLAALPAKNVELARAEDAHVTELLSAMNLRPFAPEIPTHQEPARLTERTVAGFVKFLDSLARAKYSLAPGQGAEAQPRGVLGPLDLGSLEGLGEVDAAALAASGLGGPELQEAGNRVLELVVALVVTRTPPETWRKRLADSEAELDKARAELDKAYPSPARAPAAKGLAEASAKRDAALAALREAYDKELPEAAKAFAKLDGSASPTEGSWGDLMKADRECLTTLFSRMQPDMEYWNAVVQRRADPACSVEEQKKLDSLGPPSDRRALADMCARAARGGPTLLARAHETDLALVKAKLPEIEKLLQAMESPLYAK